MPALSVVIETYNATPESKVQLQHVLARLRRQSFPRDDMEVLVVVDTERPELADFVQRTDPAAEVVPAQDPTYYGMKRIGMARARGDVVALLDSDCLPVEDWAREIVSTIRQGADVVAGRVRFPAESLFPRTFAVFDYGHLRNGPDGQAPCFNVSNAGLRGEIAREHPFDARLTRFGGGSLLGRRLNLWDSGSSTIPRPRSCTTTRGSESISRYGFVPVTRPSRSVVSITTGCCLKRGS
jgi:cellulose synthase/poly-beta-1,6-N-acetylglucosamine synthase-like glycosyltransferase